MSNIFKVNNKVTRTMSHAPTVNFEHYSTVIIVEFK